MVQHDAVLQLTRIDKLEEAQMLKVDVCHEVLPLPSHMDYRVLKNLFKTKPFKFFSLGNGSFKLVRSGFSGAERAVVRSVRLCPWCNGEQGERGWEPSPCTRRRPHSPPHPLAFSSCPSLEEHCALSLGRRDLAGFCPLSCHCCASLPLLFAGSQSRKCSAGQGM